MTTKSSKSRSAKKSKKSSPAKKATKASSKKRAAGAAPARRAEATMGKNGFRSFAMHSQEKGSASIVASIRPKTSRAASSRGGARRAAASAPVSLSSMDAESAARQYLNNALASAEMPAFTAGDVSGEKSDFKLIGTESEPLTKTQMVKFYQVYRQIPVYGSLVTVELDSKNEFVAINSSLSEPVNVNHVATLSPADALKKVSEHAGYNTKHLDATPRLYYYFDRETMRWRLVYITTNVVKLSGEGAAATSKGIPKVKDYVIDAHSGDLVAELSRTMSIDVIEDALDGLEQKRRISCLKTDRGKRLHDQTRNVHTYDLKFGVFKETKIPPDSRYVNNPPTWSPSAISAHANASVVADFIRDVLKRNGLDNQGGPFISTINCVEEEDTQVWDNAAWVGGIQIVYGQSDIGNGELRSWAVALDMVAHEMTHGLSENTAKLEYRGQSGALDESYADIFGVIINNFKKPVAKWDWRIGKDLTADETPLRDMKKPTKFEQPDHMDDYERMPADDAHDNGGVHTNSGIHNKVAYNMLTAKDSKGKFIFKPREVAAIFYIALTKHLTRTSRFSDSRRGAELAALSLFANDSKKSAKIKAVSKAFDKVGISADEPT